jgi:tetratricopeptide (TPR) repeat protein
MRSIDSVVLILVTVLGSRCASGPDAARSGDPGSLEVSMRFLEQRVAEDPEDIVALNRLGALYLQQMRITGDHSLIARAENAARASLESVPREQNPGGLFLLAQSHAASHRFRSARDLLEKLVDLHGGKSEYLGALGDSLMELGRYEEAATVYGTLVSREPDIGILTRLARFDLLHGRNGAAEQRLESALALARQQSVGDPRTVGWILWQLGEVAFARGDYRDAVARHRAGLQVDGRSVALLYAMGRLEAGAGKFAEAIALYETAIAIDPVPYIVAALADAYTLRGDAVKGAEILASVPDADPLDRRHIVLIRADHDIAPQETLAIAKAEWSQREDIYTADALAWAALKAGDLGEAKARIADARRLGTRDAKLDYHAGMIARAAGELAEAKRLLGAALALNPRFDALQSRIAKEELGRLRR